jgi:cyclic pyranopterin phosphate synthase
MLTDGYQRRIDYLRVSITDRCNLRCVYCMPSEGVQPLQHKDILSYEEIIRVVRIAAGIGVRKVRITGGEPLTRRDIPFLISGLKHIDGIKDISLTTNGILLSRYAMELADAGLDRINISLDSLKPDRYSEITRGGDLDSVIKGIEAASQAGLLPVKINMVPIRGINDDEIADFARMTLEFSHQIRFIEFMPFGTEGFWETSKYMSSEEIRTTVERIAPLTPITIRKSGPARYYRFDGAKGVIGFISPLSNHFCGECNRLRLTTEGRIRPCLFSETEIDLKPALRGTAPDNEIERLMHLAVEVKPDGHHIRLQKTENGLFAMASKKPMSRIGG